MSLPSTSPPLLLSTSRCILTRLPVELQLQIFNNLHNTDVARSRHLCREWAYDPLVTTRLFSRIDIHPHALVIRRFSETFSKSPLRASIRELRFVLEKWWLPESVVRIVARPGLRGLEKVDLEWPVVEDREGGQKVLLPLLLAEFAVMDETVVVSSYMAEELGEGTPDSQSKDWKLIEHKQIRRLIWLRYATAETLFYAVASCSRLQELRLVEVRDDDLHRLQRWFEDGVGTSHGSDQRGRTTVSRDDSTKTKTAGKLIGLTSLKSLLNRERRHRKSVNVSRQDSIDIRSSDRSTILADLRILHFQFKRSTRHSMGDGLQSIRIKLFQQAPKLEYLNLLLEDTAICHGSLPWYRPDEIGSSLEVDCFPTSQAGGTPSTIPLLPNLRKLHLRQVKCRPEELRYFLQFHCPSLEALTLESIIFMHEPPNLPHCWVRFLKTLKHECKNIRSLNICHSLCNSTFGSDGNFQHWHVSMTPMEKADHPWLKDQILEWFHDRNTGDEACPLNDWELDCETGKNSMSRHIKLAMAQTTNAHRQPSMPCALLCNVARENKIGLARPFMMDTSWHYGLCNDPSVS